MKEYLPWKQKFPGSASDNTDLYSGISSLNVQAVGNGKASMRPWKAAARLNRQY